MQIQETLPPDINAAVSAEPEMDPVEHIRLDKSRFTNVKHPDGSVVIDPKGGGVIKTEAYSIIAGSERSPDDPWFEVAYMQDGLPFDVNGRLVQDDGKTQPWPGTDADGKPVKFRPLYTPAMRAIVKKKLKKLKDGYRSAAPSDEDTEDDLMVRETEADRVSLPDWLRGQVEIPFHLLQQAVKRRYNYALTTTEEIVRTLVIEVKLVQRDNVAAHLRRFLVG